jgi:diamine N-acetyltransferase
VYRRAKSNTSAASPTHYTKLPSTQTLAALFWAVYSEDTPVGFVMIADEVGSPEYIPHYLWKLLIDERYQRQGFGTATLDLIVEYFRARPGVEVLNTSAGQGDGSPIAFYEHYGFERTGEVRFGEVLLRLKLR